MKKIVAVIISLTFLTQVQAQYKKASFFSRSGRFYELGGSFRFLGDGRTGGSGIYLSAGNATPGKHIHHFFDLEYVLPVKFHYSSVTNPSVGSSQVTTVTGKGAGSFAFRYNLGYFFGDNSNEAVKLLPFIYLNIGFLSGSNNFDYTYSPGNSYLQKEPYGENSALLYGGGGGVLYKINKTIGLRASVAYNGVYSSSYEDNGSSYSLFPTHVSTSLGIRFMLHGNN